MPARRTVPRETAASARPRPPRRRQLTSSGRAGGMIVRITTHGRTKGVVLAHTPPDLAHAMGLFQPARWSPKANAYLLGEEHLETFARHLARHDAQLVDERGDAKGDDREKFTGPLPECASCGQAAPRQAALALKFCPACGQPWTPVTPSYRGGDAATPRSACAVCDREQPGAFTFCTACGGRVVRVVTGARPAHVPRPKLAEPALFGDLVEEVAAELDPERDHMQRAAGDR